MPAGDDVKADKLGKAVKKHLDRIKDEIDKLTKTVKKTVAKKRKRKPKHR